jgi:guanylate kinase
MPDIYFSISSITRPMRDNEVQGEKYNFISLDEFEQLIRNDGLLEYNEYLGNYYGTPKKPIEKAIKSGKEAIVEVDVNGAANIRKINPDVVSIFILPPSLDELKNRLIGRGTESEDVVKKRLMSSRDEIARADEYDYIIINDCLEDAVNDFISIIKSDRHSTNRTKHLIEEVLK